MAKGFRDLVAWQRAMALVLEVYKVTHGFPREEVFGLSSQLRRAAVSVPSNIAEGQGRSTRGEFAHFLGHARGSLAEVETQLEIAKGLGLIKHEDFEKLMKLVSETGRPLLGLTDAIRRRSTSNQQPATSNPARPAQ